MVKQNCPLCSAAVSPNPRYPRYVCGGCAAKAASTDGRPLAFSNVDLSGGFAALYADTGERYQGHECFIAGIRCRADEAPFGGIVIEVVPSTRKRQLAARKASATKKRRAAAKRAAVTRKLSAAGKTAAITKKRRAAGKKAAITRKALAAASDSSLV